MRAFQASADAFPNRLKQFCFIRRASFDLAQDKLRSRPTHFDGDALQSGEHNFRRAWCATACLSNLFQRCDNEIESWFWHLQ